jgi:hypothetical protein
MDDSYIIFLNKRARKCVGIQMARSGGEIRRRLMELVEKFREKGALSPEKALTAQELGLPPWFEQAMHRRLGQLGIFIEVNGKYYLDEDRLRKIQEGYFKTEYGGRTHSWSRYLWVLLMLPIGLIVSLAIFYLLVLSGARFFPGEFLMILTIVMVVVAVIRILYWRSRRRYWPGQW